MRYSGAASVMASVLAACLMGLAQPHAVAGTHAAPAASTAFDFNIAGNRLEEVLVAIARAAGGIVLFDPALVAAQTSSGLHGRFTIEEALRTVLRGTALEPVANPDGSFGVRRIAADSAPAAADQPGTAEAPAASVGAPLPPVVSIGVDDADGANHGYTDIGFVAARSRSATRTDTPMSELPQSIQGVTSNLMESQQAQSVLDSLQSISSVAFGRGDGVDQAGTLYVRGFVAPVMKNGVADLVSLRNVTNGRVAGSRAITSLDVPIAAIDRVEVMGGADSIIVGGPMEPGGSVNVLTKRPQADRIRELTLDVSSNGHRRAAFDLGGALSDDQIWTYRAILSTTHDKRTFDGYDGARELYIAPSIGYKHRGTSFVAGFSHQVSRSPFGGYQNALLDEDGPGPDIRTSPWGRADDHSFSAKTEYFYSLEQELRPGWTFISKGQFTRQRYDSAGYGNCMSIDSDADLGVCFADQSSLKSYTLNLDNSVRVKFSTGEMQHTVLAGMSYGRTRLASYTDVDNFQALATTWPPSDLSLPAIATGKNLISDDDTIYYSNLYLQDQMKWRRWHVLMNVGYEQERNNFSSDPDMNGVVRDTSPPRNVPVYNIGVAYKLTDKATLYANTFRSFTPGSKLLDSTLNGGPPGINVAPPTTGKSAEVGLKLKLLDNRATFTAALYRATHTNVLQFVFPTTISPYTDYVLLPSAVSRGVEMNLTGRMARGWNLTASYSYISFQPAKSPGDDIQLSQFPRHRASLWSTYDMQSEALRGWGFGLGLTMRSGYTAFSDADTLVRIPGQTRTDASIYYKSRFGRTTLGIKNLFDRRLYSEFATYTIGVEPRRTVTLTNVIEF
ncbi:MAG: Ferrichrome outer membrane transporter/phage receptor [Herbaspirillum frisingense]|uniref:Ferrichrome outer membrane transporter/phage receptor n=1 Tax=Herbaspirillum frisingense TaxID=92645 RepID=A0A7V8FTU1_9BURK|nr:MAG: Ferrichrome outer membrane transporter/phage receptor [Herbaspirillum frisingense]